MNNLFGESYTVSIDGQIIDSVNSYHLEFTSKESELWNLFQPYKRNRNKFYLRNKVGQSIVFEIDDIKEILKEIPIWSYKNDYSLNIEYTFE